MKTRDKFKYRTLCIIQGGKNRCYTRISYEYDQVVFSEDVRNRMLFNGLFQHFAKIRLLKRILKEIS